MSVHLSVNLNAIAFLRNRRDLPWPKLLDFAQIVAESGAHGITVHPRPDKRHILYTDVVDLKNFLNQQFPHLELNVEGFPDNDFLNLIEETSPHQITLVPDKPMQKTSDHGWDLERDRFFLYRTVGRLKKLQTRVSLFCDSATKDLNIAKEIGADRIEIFTGPYGVADHKNKDLELQKIKNTALKAQALGLKINAGHDLTINNIPPLIKMVPFISEMSIGHALISETLKFGLKNTIKLFLNAMAYKP